jgi:3',5'-cyclic AMP phosphodiesterase CpdA
MMNLRIRTLSIAKAFSRSLLLALFLILPSLKESVAHPPNSEGKHADHAHDEATGKPLSVITTRNSTVVLPPGRDEDVFHFVVYGDRTGGVPEGIKVLQQAVVDTNLLDPDLVMTVGDLIQGYNEEPEWMLQMNEYKSVMSKLNMPWYPVAGNHDVYWRGKQAPPPGQHDSNYEKHFGPLWYAFKHKFAGFIVLYSDEGDPVTNEKGFEEGRLQQMSQAQLDFLDKAIVELADQKQVFVFLHHPRWIQKRYEGSNWDVVHRRLVQAGNVTGVFAGHIHQIHFGGVKDNIAYYTLATTGGALSADLPGAGFLHHMNMVTVRPDTLHVASLAVGSVTDPRDFTEEFLNDVSMARGIAPKRKSPAMQINTDGDVQAELVYEISNPSKRAIEVNVTLDTSDGQWQSDLDHQHIRIAPGTSTDVSFNIFRDSSYKTWSIPRLELVVEYLAEKSRIVLPVVSQPLEMDLAAIPSTYFQATKNQCLKVEGVSDAVRIESDQIKLPNGPLTLECWVKPSKLDQQRGIVAKTELSEYALFMDEGVPEFNLFLGSAYVTAKATTKLSTDRWTHLAGVYDGGQVSLYVDGKRVSQTKGTGVRRKNQLPLWIGADPHQSGNANRPFEGLIDEVRLSAKAIYEGDSFTPERRLLPSKSTRWLNHFDQRLGPYELNHADGGGQALFGKTATLLPVEDK